MTFDDLEFYQRLQQRFRDEFKDFIIASMVDLLNRHQCTTLSLVGYTPYFMDGDICEYSINRWATQIDDKYVGEYSDGGGGEYDLTEDSKEIKCYSELERLLDKIPETLFRDVFGDHQTIVFHVNQDVTMKDYSHD